MGIEGLVEPKVEQVLKVNIPDSWHKGYRLQLVAGMHEIDHQLAKLIEHILKDDFGLVGVNLAKSYTKNPKDYKHLPPYSKPLVVGMHPNSECRQDAGKNELQQLERDHIVYITHPFNTYTESEIFDFNGMKKEIYARYKIDVATTVTNIRLFGRLLKQARIDHKLLTLATPVGPYDLNHSVIRKEREGFIETDILRMYLEDVANAGFKQIITLHSHSPTTGHIANDLGIDFIDIDPFRTKAECGETRLGPFLYEPDPEHPGKIRHRSDYEKRMDDLTPFMSHIKEKYKDKDDVYFMATDDGIWPTIEKICYQYRKDKQQLIGILKERIGAGDIKITGTRTGSTATLDEIKGKTIVLCDDRRLSGGTLNDIAEVLKEEFGVRLVDAYISHDMSVKENFREQKHIDSLTILETNPNSYLNYENDPRVIRLPMYKTALLIASEIYKSYCDVREHGPPKVR